MKRLLIIILLILSITLIGCQKEIVADTTPQTVTVTSIITQTSIVTIEDTQRIDELEAELKQYRDLIGNLNNLLKDVYYVYQKKSDASSSWGTGFSIEYNGKYYLITAGHCVDGIYGVFKNLGFKANFTDNFIYPKLLVYKNDYLDKNDYAIFYSDKMKTGFIVDNENDNPAFIIGNENFNIIRGSNISGNEGESGSPIVDNEGEITGIATTDLLSYSTDIDKVMKAIDNLK